MSIVNWEAKYSEGTTPWERERLSPSTTLVPKPETVNSSMIIPGCGRSSEPLHFAQQGFAVTGLDLAPSATEFQNSTFNQAGANGTFVTADIFEWLPQTPADIIYEQTCLCALPPELWQAYESQIHNWLKPGGLLIINFLQTSREDGPPFHCEIDVMEKLFFWERWTWKKAKPIKIQHEPHIFELTHVIERI